MTSRLKERVRFDLDRRPTPGLESPVLTIELSEVLAEAMEANPLTQPGDAHALSVASGLTKTGSFRAHQTQSCTNENRDDELHVTFGHNHTRGTTGLTQGVYRRPQLTRLLCRMLKKAHPEANFSAICITCNCTQRCHRDIVNQVGTLNYLLPVSSFKGGDLWVENSEVGEDQAVYRHVPSQTGPEVRKGEILSVKPSLVFNARALHEVQEASGDRWMLIGYTPRKGDQLSTIQVEKLQTSGFPVTTPDSPPADTPAVRTLAFAREPGDQSLMPSLECVAAPVMLQRCRESVLHTYDRMQGNLKQLVRRAKRFWGVDNDQDRGPEVATFIRETEHRICTLEDALTRAASDPAEIPLLAP